MPEASEEANVKTYQLQGHTVTCSCKLLPTLALWEPIVLIRRSWNAIETVDLISSPGDYRDEPDAALRIAEERAAAWVASNPPGDVGA